MFQTYIHKRINIVMLVIIFCFVLIIFKVFYIQVIDYDKLNNLANGLWSRNLPIEADRGKISTIDGEVISDNLTTVSLVFIPNQIDDDLKAKIVHDIADILGCDEDAIGEHIYKKSSIERVHPEGRRLTYEQADKIDALGYEGVYLVKESKRVYPHDLLLCHILGYVGIDNQGLSGLELQYDDYLTGVGGSVNVDGARIKCWKHGGHGSRTFLEVVQNSCNPVFVELGRRLGKETLFKYIDGFGKKTGVDLNGEGSGILFSVDKVGPVELATTAFG